MEEREKKIADGLDAANRAARDLELAQQKAGDQLRESKEKAAEYGRIKSMAHFNRQGEFYKACSQHLIAQNKSWYVKKTEMQFFVLCGIRVQFLLTQMLLYINRWFLFTFP